MGSGRQDLLNVQQTHWNLNGTFNCGNSLYNYIQDITWKEDLGLDCCSKYMFLEYGTFLLTRILNFLKYWIPVIVFQTQILAILYNSLPIPN
jgi:hypothetical protein